MIYLFTGTPGAGKSYHMAESIYYAINSGHHVVANFDVNSDMLKHPELFHYWDNYEITPSKLEELSREVNATKEGSIKLFLDEVGVIFNARDYQAPDRRNWVKFFLQHRKLKYDVFLVTQFDTMIDKQIRSLVEYEIKHRKLNNVGWVGKMVSLLTINRPVFVCVTYWYPMKQRLSSEFVLGRKKFYNMYDTSEIFSKEGGNIGDATQFIKGVTLTGASNDVRV